MWISFRNFHGEVPRIRDKRELPQGYAQTARNCVLEGGTIRPIKGLTLVDTPAKAGTKRTIYYYRDSSPDVFLHWTEDVDVIRSIIEGDVTGLAIFTGASGGYPRITNATLATGGGGALYPKTSYRLGVPAPTTAPSATVLGDPPSEEEELTPEHVAYRYCFVNKSFSYDQEGPLSMPSGVVEAYFTEGQSVRLDSLETSLPGYGYNTTNVVKHIYRGAVGYSTVSWVFVAEVPIGADSYTDTTPAASLSLTTADNEEFYPPPDGLSGIKVMPNGIVVGFYRNTVHLSEPWQPHAFPPDYVKPVDWNIVCIGTIGQSGVIVTQGQPYLLMGSHPSNMTLTKLVIGHPGRSKRGGVEIDGTFFYPTTDGIAMVSLDDAGLASLGILDRPSWSAYSPSSISAFSHSDWYVGFNTASGFMFHPGSKEFVSLDTVATAGYHDKLSGNLFLQIGASIYQWDSDASSPLTMTYKTKAERVPYQCCMACGMVLAKEYPVTFRLYGDGVLRKTVIVENGDPFWMKGGYLAREYEIEVSGTNEVIWFGAGESIEDVWGAVANGI